MLQNPTQVHTVPEKMNPFPHQSLQSTTLHWCKLDTRGQTALSLTRLRCKIKGASRALKMVNYFSQEGYVFCVGWSVCQHYEWKSYELIFIKLGEQVDHGRTHTILEVIRVWIQIQ